MENTHFISGNDEAFKTIRKEQIRKNLFSAILLLSVIIMLVGLIFSLGLYSAEKTIILEKTAIAVKDASGNVVPMPYFTDLSSAKLMEIILTRINIVLFVVMIIAAVVGFICTVIFAILRIKKVRRMNYLTKVILD